ncbi:MAG: thioredoxin domain-containing protein [Candidatus Pacebacteria bacterium]|nr:thioredoxin domain-containing protein [Candidatus Paceibacterota bacterium]
MKNKNKTGFMQKILSSPLLFIVIIMVLFGTIIYFSSSDLKSSSYQEDKNWSNAENIKGPENAPITMVEYGDYECPACRNSYGMVKEVINEYQDQIKLIYRHYPLQFHKDAQGASIASECAGEQGKFWEMHEKLYTGKRGLKEKGLKIYAKEVGVDEEKFNECFAGNGYFDKINKQKEQGEKDAINGTPAFFINGKQVINSRNSKYLPTIQDFRNMINAELEGS